MVSIRHVNSILKYSLSGWTLITHHKLHAHFSCCFVLSGVCLRLIPLAIQCYAYLPCKERRERIQNVCQCHHSLYCMSLLLQEDNKRSSCVGKWVQWNTEEHARSEVYTDIWVKIRVTRSVKQCRLIITDVSNSIMILYSLSNNDLLGASDHEF